MVFCSFNHSPLEGESQKPSRQAKAEAVGGSAVQRPVSREATVCPDKRGGSPHACHPCKLSQNPRPRTSENLPENTH